MSALKPGDFITAKCSRCNDTTGHVIMIILDGIITKVECKACGSVHKYRDPSGRPAAMTRQATVRHVKAGQTRQEGRIVRTETRVAEEAPTVPRTPSPRKSSTARLESAWQEAMAKHGGEAPKPYSMHDSFLAHTLLEHPLFGLGEIVETVKPDKITVLFQDGIKTLRCKLQ